MTRFLQIMEGLTQIKSWVSPSGEILPVPWDEMHDDWAVKKTNMPKGEATHELFRRGWGRMVPYGSNVLIHTEVAPLGYKVKAAAIRAAQDHEKSGVVHNTGVALNLIWEKD